MDLGIKGRVAIVTGGDSGMSYKSAEYLLRAGVWIVLTDIDQGKVTAAAKELTLLGEVKPVAADLTTEKGAALLKAFASKTFPNTPTILMHAAGITGATGISWNSAIRIGSAHCRPISWQPCA